MKTLAALLALLCLTLLCLISSVMVLVSWFHHQDHAALGWMFLGNASGFWAASIVRSRR